MAGMQLRSQDETRKNSEANETPEESLSLKLGEIRALEIENSKKQLLRKSQILSLSPSECALSMIMSLNTESK